MGNVPEKQTSSTAFVATPQLVEDPNWYFDNGASNLVTNNPTVIEKNTANYGKGQIIVGNGAQIEFDQSGLTYIPCQNKSVLKDTLIAPKVSKNLV